MKDPEAESADLGELQQNCTPSGESAYCGLAKLIGAEAINISRSL